MASGQHDMGAHMKTTCRSETTLRRLIEMGLRLVLERRADSREIHIQPVTVGGRGLQPEFRDGSWESLRSAIYVDRPE